MKPPLRRGKSLANPHPSDAILGPPHGKPQTVMSNALTKPRFSFLHLGIILLTFVMASSLVNHWDAFKAGFQDGWNAASPSSKMP
jgi:hypothetical protein